MRSLEGYGQVTESEARQRGLAGREVTLSDGRAVMVADAPRLWWTPKRLMAPAPLAPPWSFGLPVKAL